MHRVVITDCLEPPALIEEAALAGLATVDCLMAKSVEGLRGRLADAEGIILYHEVTLPNDILAECKQCKVIVRGGVGYDNVELKAAGERGILVCNVPDYGVDEVADHAIGSMLGLMRGFVMECVNLETLLAESHAVSLHTPLTEGTQQLMNAKRLRQMRSDAYLINTSRGAVVDTVALGPFGQRSV